MGVGTFGQIIELPWPPAKLSPNGSHGSHWARAKLAKKYRGDSLILLRSQGVSARPFAAPIMLHLTFCPPTRARFDLDNALAKTKHGIDALAEAMGVNDQMFEFTLRRGDPVKGGKVLVEL